MTDVLPQHPYKHVRRLPNFQEPTLGRYSGFINAMYNSLEVLLYARCEYPVLQQLDDRMKEQGTIGEEMLVEPVRRDG